MKKTVLFFLLFPLFTSYSQLADGNWYGKLNVNGVEMPIGILIETTDAEKKVFLTNPSDKNSKFLFDSVSFTQKEFYLQHNALGIKYLGKINSDSLVGIFYQNGFALDLNLSQIPPQEREIRRPQTPEGPFDYFTEEIEAFNVVDSVTLSGTLTLPTNNGKKYPVVILVTGSSPQNRDSEILQHKSFAVIADHLARQGIGSYRYDDRGVEKSTGTYAGSDLSDFYRDLDAVVQVINKRKEVEKLGIAGHSEGGILAPWYACNNKKIIDFVILLAAPGIPINEMMLLQRENVFQGMGMTPAQIQKEKQFFINIDKIVLNNDGEDKTYKLDSLISEKASAMDLTEGQMELYKKGQMSVMNGAWYKSFVAISPETYLKKVRCSVLAVAGAKDIQVPIKENINGIASGLGKSKSRFLKKRTLQYKTFGDLNHLLQPSETGMPNEYGKIETTFSRDVLFLMSDFINEL
jgi:uncharacterized protein